MIYFYQLLPVQRDWPVSANVRSNMDVSNGFGNRMDKDVSQICAEVLHTSSSSPQELGDSFRNNVSEDSPITSHLLRDDSLQETISLGLGFLVSDRERGEGVEVYFKLMWLEAAVLNLVADDSGGMQKQKSRFHWDKEYLVDVYFFCFSFKLSPFKLCESVCWKRSKKYIKLNNGDRVTASGKIKTEGGAKVTANKTGIYKRWKEQSHNKISLKGSSYEGNAEESRSFSGGNGIRGDNRRFKGGKKHWSMPNAHVRSEIKDVEQVRKERQKKATRNSYMKSKSKGKKFGKNGKKGGGGRQSSRDRQGRSH